MGVDEEAKRGRIWWNVGWQMTAGLAICMLAGGYDLTFPTGSRFQFQGKIGIG